MALLHLAHEAGLDCHAVTVDHRMREGSGAEARLVARACERLGVPHRIVARGETEWSGQRAAREGRYGLLAEVARELAAPIAVAHTLDDQAETVRMRAARGGGTLGLSGIPPVARLGDVALLRPLLGVGRAELRDWLRHRGIGWIDDPSNEDEASERIFRRRRPTLPAAQIARLATAARAHRAVLMRAIAADFASNLAPPVYRPGLVGTMRVHAVRILAARIGGSTHLPSQARVATFLEREKALTIAGTLLRKEGGGIAFRREARRTLPQEERLRFVPASDEPRAPRARGKRAFRPSALPAPAIRWRGRWR